MRAAIYARFSSDLQNPKSADDQLDACRKYVEARGGLVVVPFKDEGISGASVENRKQLQALLAIAGNDVFDAVVVESLDRLSRSVGDIDRIRQKLNFHRVKLITLADGEANSLVVGMRGIIGAAYLDDLRQKTKRGQLAALEKGKVAGGRCYGYDVLPGGKGERAVNDEQAAVVRRIFNEYAEGRSADDIAKGLNAERVPSPRGKSWRANTILGGSKDSTGVLRNELYRAVFVFNRHEYVKSPDTGERLARHNDKSQWLRQDMPHLRIVDDATWNRVNERLTARSATHKIAVSNKQMTRRAPRLLSGLIKCGTCGGAMHVVRDDRMQCIEHRSGASGCTNARMVSLNDVETRVVTAVRDRLLSPELIERALKAARDEMMRLREDENKRRRTLEKELQDAKRELQAMLRMVKSGDAPETILDGMREVERRKGEIELALADVPDQTVELHPSAPNRYRNMVEELWSSIRRSEDARPGRVVSNHHGRFYTRQGSRHRAAKDAAARESDQVDARNRAREALRSLVDHVVIAPDGHHHKRGGGPVSVTVHGQLGALLVEGERTNPSDDVRRVPLVAGVGFEPTTFRL